MKRTQFPSKRAFAAAVKRLTAEAKRHGRTLAEQLSLYSNKRQIGSVHEYQRRFSIPPKLFQQLVYATAQKFKRTPVQHLKNVLNSGVEHEAPKELQNWYAQIFGEFASGRLSEVMREVLLYGANRDD